MDIRHIFCVGRNFQEHAAEMGSEAPKYPMIFQKPTHALTHANGNEITYPQDRGAIHFEIEIVLYIGKPVTDSFSVNDVVTKMALGVDMTLRDEQSELKRKGHPWLIAKGFRNAAVLTDFWDYPGEDVCQEVDFSLYKNGGCVQSGNTSNLIFDFQTLLTYIHQHVGLSEGDVIFTGTPHGVGPIANNDLFGLKWGNEEKGRFRVKME